ncbi:MAG TPA: IclR family transcriptional regulator [bacterium]|nr:IclR family transcriptional regulator [bacterium]
MKNGAQSRVALERYRIQALDRGLDLLELLRDARTPLRLADVARRLRMVKSSAFRFLCTLEKRGYVDREEPSGEYRLGMACARYSRSMKAQPLTQIALPQMRVLLERFGETVNLAVLRGGQIFYVEILESPHSFRMAAQVGTTAFAHSTAVGKAIAAFLPRAEGEAMVSASGLPRLTARTITTPSAWQREVLRTRARGFSEDDAENEPGACCLGAPIFEGVNDRVIAALSISGPADRMQIVRHRAVQALVRSCKAISRAMGHHDPAMRRSARVRSQ